MSFEKIVKLACKPKAAPPKAKYLDPIIAATYAEDGAVSDVCRALAPRLREPNATVVFKGLIVLHTMVRTGNTENVLSYLAQNDTLRLQNVASGHWEGYSAPENLGQYANYLQSRIKAYRELKHDPVRVQSESNRDHRVSVLEGDREWGSNGPGAGVSRSKTIIGRKLRVMSVEKGLLRETKVIQGVVDALVDTKFYLDNLEEELNVLALRMLVKDLLVLFQAVNEGVINVLEHYFEMSHVDATDALALYRRFCRQTERVVEYLSIAKKLQNLLNVSIPNLKHAPVSLVNSLEEYLNDPNFEENRLEYKANKAAADGKPVTRQKTPAAPPPSSAPPPLTNASASSSTAAKATKAQSVADFFSSIEQEQANMFNPNTDSPTANYFQQQASINPFVQRQSMLLPQQTGAIAFQPQPTGFPGQPGPFFQTPQATGFPSANPVSAFFGSQLPPQQQNQFLAPQAQSPSSAFLQTQPTGFLQPQPTGSNPFRASTLFPQATGLPAFGGPSSPSISNHNPFPRPGSASGLLSGASHSALPPLQEMPTGFGSSNAFNVNAGSSAFSPAPLQPPNTSMFGGSIQRPSSTPIKSENTPMTSVVSHKTGTGSNSRNPFGQPAPPPPPPVPKAPTLQQLATGAGWSSLPSGSGSGTSTPLRPTSAGGDGGFRPALQAQPTGNGLIGSIASSFATGSGSGASSPPPLPTSSNSPFASFLGGNQNGGSPTISSQPTASSTWSSAFGGGGGSSAFSTTSTIPTSASSLSSPTPPSISPLQPQPTGFGGSTVRPFKPSSNFGASIVDKLPTIPSEPNTPAITGGPTGPLLGGGNSGSGTPALPSFGGLSLFSSASGTTGALNSYQNQSQTPSLFGAGSAGGLGGLDGFGGGLQPQATGVVNPFRPSGLGGTSSPTPNSASAPSFGSGAFGDAFSPSTGNGTNGSPSLQPSFTGFGTFSSQFTGSAFGGSPAPGTNNNQQQQQQSLI